MLRMPVLGRLEIRSTHLLLESIAVDLFLITSGVCLKINFFKQICLKIHLKRLTAGCHQ